MRRLRVDTINQKLLSGNTESPLKSGITYEKYSKIPFKWSDPEETKMHIWFNNTSRVMKVRPDAGHLYSFTPDTAVTTTTTTSSSSTISTTSSSTTQSTTTTTV